MKMQTETTLSNDNGYSFDIRLCGIGAFNNRWKADRHKKARDHYIGWIAEMAELLFRTEPGFIGGGVDDGARDMVLRFAFKSQELAEQFKREFEAGTRKAA